MNNYKVKNKINPQSETLRQDIIKFLKKERMWVNVRVDGNQNVTFAGTKPEMGTRLDLIEKYAYDCGANSVKFS